MYSVEVRNLKKEYKNLLALNGLTVQIPKNKIIGLIGKNGAGKTTFLKTCVGRIKHTSGEIRIFGEEVFDNLNILSKLIFVDEELSYSTSYKVSDILKLASIYYDSWDNVLAEKLVNHFGLVREKKFKQLSRGMKTQINVIVGICSRMPLTILDEPTLGLDPAFRLDFYEILLKDFKDHPRTIIISSHLLNELENLLEEVILIDKGELILHSSMSDFSDYAVKLSSFDSDIGDLLEGKVILSEKEIDGTYEWIIKNELSKNDYHTLEKKKIRVTKVKPQDLFILLTRKGVPTNEL